MKTAAPLLRSAAAGKASYQDLLAEVKKLTADLQALREQTIETLTPAVQELVRSGSRDVQRIEHTLDQLLDVACLPEGLAFFKTLCRHYWALDPQATASYIHAYREMWEDDEPNDADEGRHEPQDAGHRFDGRGHARAGVQAAVSGVSGD